MIFSRGGRLLRVLSRVGELSCLRVPLALIICHTLHAPSRAGSVLTFKSWTLQERLRVEIACRHLFTELSQAWSQLDKTRKELRRMEHRVGDLGEGVPTSNHSAYLRPTGAGVSTTSEGERSRSEHSSPLNARREPVARCVDLGVRPSRPQQSHGAKRKISRLDKHATEPRGKIGSGTSRRPHHPRDGASRSSSAGESCGVQHSRPSASATNVTSEAPVTLNLAGSGLKRVDFSERLRLREVRWDGTIRDSVALPLATSSENATFSVPAAIADASSLSSFSSSSVARPSDSFSTLTDSRALRETEIRFLNEYVVGQERPRGRTSARLTHVQVEVPGSSGHEHAKGAPRGHEVVGVRDREDRVSGRGAAGGRVAASGYGGGGGGAAVLSRAKPVTACANMINSDSERPTLGPACARRDGGDELCGAAGGPSEGSPGATSSRMQKIKKTLKDLPNDECVLAKLREKIRQQRLSASSSDTSHSESSTLGHTDSSREPTPQHVLHELHEPVLVGEGRQDPSLTPDKVPRTRKVASGPPLPSYKGFSEVPFDPFLQAKVRQINWLSAPKKKAMQKPTNPAQAGIQTHVKFTANAASSVPAVPATSSATTDKTRRVGRIVATHQNNSSKPGAKDIITTSSWRAGQELVLRELGATKTRSHSTDRNNSGGVHKGGSNSEHHSQVQLEQGDVDSTQLPVSGKGADGTEQLARSRALSEDAKKMLQDLQLDNEEKERRSISFRRPAVKRKAPKPEKEGDEHTAHKHKHYDSESVRQYIAKQKAQRQQQKEAQRKAEMEEAQKRQQLMQDLIAKQKSAAMFSKPKKGNRSCKNHVGVSPDQDCSAEQNSLLLVSSHTDKENAKKDGKMDVSDDEESDVDTLTGSNDDGSTPRATPVEKRDHVSKIVQEETATELYHSLFQRLKPHQQHHHHHAVRQPATDTRDPNPPPNTGSAFMPTGTSKFPARILNLDVDKVLSRFAQVVDQRRSHGARVGLPGGGAENGFMLGPSSLDSNGEKLRDEKLKVLKANSQTLQSKLTQMEKSIRTEVPNDSESCNMEAEFVSHHERIAGSRDKYSVFTSNLPGAQTVGSRHSDSESANDVRASRPSSREAGNALGLQRDNYMALQKATRPAALVPEKAEEDSSVTEVSTFSEITAADESSNNTRSLKVSLAVADKPVVAGMQYKAPSAYKWEEPKADPYSIFNVFSRQVHHGSRALRLRESEQPADSASANNSNTAVVKDPIITSTQHIVTGHTSRGHQVVAKTTYTRMEATLVDRNQAPQQAMSSRNRATRSDERGPLSSVGHTSAPSLSMSDDSRSLESAEEDMPKAGFSKQGTSGQFASGFQRQTSDTGQETDVSQMSEDEPRTSLKTFEGASSVPHPQAEAKWSPAALERQMAAELARLESLGDSLQQLSSMERTRAVALAQQETVSLAQILKARQQEHSAELRSLQLQVQEERLASAKELHQQLHNIASSQQRTAEAATSVTRDTVKSTATLNTAVSKQLLEQAENRRPDAKVSRASVSRSRSWNDTDYSETATSTPLPKPMPKSHSRYSYTSSSRTKSVASENVKTAEDTHSDSDSSIQTASDVDTHKTDASIAEEVPDGDYSMSFDDSLTEEESFKQVLPSESHRKDARRRKSDNFQASISKDEASSLALGDLTSLFTGEDSFSRFTAGMVRQIMREEELRSQHQAALLKLREKALKEKTKAELAWLKQQRQRMRDKGADDVYPQLDHKEQTLLKHLQEQQAEIRHLREANRLASKERQSLLKQHEEIARMQQETRQKLKTLQKHGAGRLGRPAEVHTEDEANLVEELSDANEDTSLMKTAKSDSEMYGDLAYQRKPKGEKQNLRKQQKLRLDQKYLTAREQKLMERKKQASELLKWKLDLDAEEEKVMQLEQSALQAWGTRTQPAEKKKSKDAGKDSSKNHLDNKVESLGNLRPETATRPEKVATTKEESLMLSHSEAISTHISVSKSERTDHRKMHTETSGGQSHSSASYSPQASGSESSIPEDIPDGPGTSRPTSGREKQRVLDSSDETIINSSINEEEEADNPAQGRGKKSSVGRLLPPGNSPLPVLWSRKTGSESESEESVSHTETISDVSDYEARIRQLSDLLQRRRKEADMLKKERSRRKKDKLKAQEESLKKQLEAYENFIAQVKAEQVDLEHEAGRPTVRPQIKQPKSSPSKSSIASSSSSPSPSGRGGHRDEGSNSSSLDETRDSAESNQTSPALSEGQDSTISPRAEKEKAKKKTATFMDRISEGSESRSEHSPESSAKSHSITNKNHSISEDRSVPEVIEDAIDEDSQLISVGSGRSHSGAFTIKTSLPPKVDEESKTHNSLADEAHSYSMDFTEGLSQSLGHSHNRKLPSARSEASYGSGQGIKSEAEISECIESAAASSAKSPENSLSSPPKLILNKSPSGSIKDTSATSHPITGIQESDSENESRINSHRSLSRPSSERSTGSTTFSDMHDFEEEEDVTSSESDRTPVKAGTPTKEKTVQMEMDLSVSASLPSLSEKHSSSKTAQVVQRESLDAQLGDLLGLAEDEATPTHTPRATSPLLDQEENSSLMLTDPLADFHEGDPVLVGGLLLGRLRFKGTVAFAPGFWAGVELDKADGDMSGEREGVSYFHCKPKHGVLVPGSEISLVEEVDEARDGAQSRVGMFEDAVSLDNSLTDQDDVSSATEGAEPVKTTVSAVVRKVLDGEDADEGEKMPVNTTASQRERGTFDILADSITENMTQSLMNESIERMTCIASHQAAPVKVPPATLPKPAKTPPQTSPKPKWNGSIDITTSAMVGGLLDDALTKIIQIRRGQQESSVKEPYDAVLVNWFSDDSGVEASRDSSRDGALPASPDLELTPGGELKEFEDAKCMLSAQPLSSELFHRPKSPVPGDGLSSQEREDLDGDISSVLGVDAEYIDDDFGLGKLPPPYPGSEDKTIGEQLRGGSKPHQHQDIFAVPHERAEVEKIVAQAVEIFWNLRRCGESWESVPVPASFLQEGENEETTTEPRVNTDIVTCSRRSYRHLLFDLTGEILREIYQYENEVDPPAWQKPVPKRQRYYKGITPPTTVDVLLPVVQTAAVSILGLNGAVGKMRGKTVNKWSVRKKKDHVDAVLVKELQEEEADWISYNHDETAVKLQLTDTIFESLLADTVDALNRIYTRRQLHSHH